MGLRAGFLRWRRPGSGRSMATIGELANYAFSLGKGDIFLDGVELKNTKSSMDSPNRVLRYYSGQAFSL